MTDVEKVRVCEILSLAQRVLDNARGDLMERRTEAANAKLELLNLELGIYKKDYSDEDAEAQSNDALDGNPQVSNDLSFMNPPVENNDDIIDVEATETTAE